MKKAAILLLILPFIISCNSAEKKRAEAVELMSVRTMGLAYLEEYNFEQAEKEFLKFIDLAPRDKFGYANLGLTYLRTGRYDEAEKQLLRAVKIDPEDPDIRLILATVYQMKDQKDKAIKELEQALTFSPGHPKVLYDLTEIYSVNPDPEDMKKRDEYTAKLLSEVPENMVPHLNMIEISIRNGNILQAIEQLKTLQKQFPEFPGEAKEYFDNTLASLEKKDTREAMIQFNIFNNYMKITNEYQQGILALKGPGGSMIGFPLITFDQKVTTGENTTGAIADIKFTDVTTSAGLDVISPGGNLPAHVEAADFNGDGEIDLYAGSGHSHFLLENTMGKFNLAGEAGIGHKGTETSATFADYDNDGFMDLLVTREEGDILYRNNGKGTFTDVTSASGISMPGSRNALFFDHDHDGDLDLVRISSTGGSLLRNNLDQTFKDVTAGDMPGALRSCSDGAFCDFDDDGDVDLVVLDDMSGNIFFSNQRQAGFRNLTDSAGLRSPAGKGSVTPGDYNNDGFIDLLTITDNGSVLFRNTGTGKFETEKNADLITGLSLNIKSGKGIFLDFDNDGSLDILAAGEPLSENGRGIFLFHNAGNGRFTDLSKLLPGDLPPVSDIETFDYNTDGDIDIVIAGKNGKIIMLRNDGGNNNHFIRIRLVGLRAGSTKNNHFGIGSRVEIRAGDLYQATVVTSPDIHFGLGSRSRADVIRIVWTNGVPQNIFSPDTDQSLIEEQTLKGSCPFLFTWNGEAFQFIKDILLRSSLGMPMEIRDDTVLYPVPYASDDYLRIPGESLQPKEGLYKIKISTELMETMYLDRIRLVAVDHPDSTDIYVKEHWCPYPFPELKIYPVGLTHEPVSASDGGGNDVLEYIAAKDDNYLANFRSGTFQGVVEMKDLVLDPGAIRGNKLIMFLDGWIFPTDASINTSISQSGRVRLSPPCVQVINSQGQWQTVISDIGFPLGKEKVMIVDMTGKFLSNDRRIRIRTNMEIYWDHIFFTERFSAAPVVSTEMAPVSALLNYRGISGAYRKGGPNGPHWLDHSKVTKYPKWRALSGNYTRYGEVLPLLEDTDNKYIITASGDETSIDFNYKDLPALKKGWKRDFLIHCTGWIKEGDVNTMYGDSVKPLPYHGMKSYGMEGYTYPADAALEDYNRQYNTRVVNSDEYKYFVKNMTTMEE